MKKVCFIISGTLYSGAEVVLDRYLQNNNYIDPYFIIIFKNNNIEKSLKQRYGNIKVINLGLRYNANIFRFFIPLYIKKVEKNLKVAIDLIKPEVIYVNNTFEGILCSKYIYHTNKKSILHIHDMRESYTHPYNNYIINKYFKYYKKIITVSEATKNSWELEDMKVIYNGLDNKYFKMKNVYGDINNIAFIGSLDYRKGADIILDSLDSLNNMGLNIFIVYKSGEKKLIKKLKKYKSNKNIHIYNNLNEKEVMELYEKIDLIMVPSKFDPLPTVIMEAQARGVLIIGNNTSGIPEMIPKKEFIYNIINKHDIENSIKYIKSKNKEEIEEAIKTNYRFAKDKFLIERKIEQINNIIEEV